METIRDFMAGIYYHTSHKHDLPPTEDYPVHDFVLFSMLTGCATSLAWILWAARWSSEENVCCSTRHSRYLRCAAFRMTLLTQLRKLDYHYLTIITRNGSGT